MRTAAELHRRVKRLSPNISIIYTGANSCCRLAFERIGAPEPHVETKAQTHLVKPSNSSLRDNLARFNRRSKRHSKMLAHARAHPEPLPLRPAKDNKM